MKRYLFIVLFLMLEFSFSQMIVPDTSKMSETDKMIWYQNEKKSPAKAVFYSWLLPTSGHAYAGDWKKGIMFKVAELGMFFGGFIVQDLDDFSMGGIVGQTMVLISPAILIWEYYDVVKTTTLYNKQLYNNLFGEEPKIKISFMPKSNGLGFSLSYNL